MLTGGKAWYGDTKAGAMTESCEVLSTILVIRTSDMSCKLENQEDSVKIGNLLMESIRISAHRNDTRRDVRSDLQTRGDVSKDDH
jgi:hypothetical protein